MCLSLSLWYNGEAAIASVSLFLRADCFNSPQPDPEGPPMKTWRKPQTTEIAVGTEINAYACAGL